MAIINNLIQELREWAPLDVFDKIPSRIQKGILFKDLNINCFDLVEEYIALGSDAGIIFWYNRITGDIQKLKTEVSSSITCVRIVDSVEYMVAGGSINGHVNIFQIPKEIPPELNIAAPLTKQRPIERYTIRDLHKTTVRVCCWSKNGMKLYSGDKNGVVVLTELDYQGHLTKSVEILNESYDIVQLSVHQGFLLISTLYRTIICQREKNIWRIIQVGKHDRKILGEFGATFLPNLSLKNSKIIASRPGLRFWISDLNGNVEKTLIFKDSSVAVQSSASSIPLLNPSRNTQIRKLTNFNIILLYMDKYVVTCDDVSVYILDLGQLKIEAVLRGFRNILNISICNREIFVLEGSRSLIRIAPKPEPPKKSAKIIFSPLLPPPMPFLSSFTAPIEYEAEDSTIIDAQECFELPPIEELNLNIKIECPTQISYHGDEEDKLSRLETLNKISNLEFDESILYRSQKCFKNRKNVNDKTKRYRKKSQLKNEEKTESSVEAANESTDSSLGYLDETTSENTIQPSCSTTREDTNNEEDVTTTKSFPMDISYCTESIIITQSPSTKLNEIDFLKQEQNVDPDFNLLHHDQIANFINLPKIDYPMNGGAGADVEVQTTPRKKLYFINEGDDVLDDFLTSVPFFKCKEYDTFCYEAEQISKKEKLKFIPTQPLMSPTTSKECDIPEIRNISSEMKIPTLWSKENPSSSSTSSSNSSEWEFVETK